ncbi:hypothetical protein [Paenibacillus sp. L3-i20]|uniref:hypothetical protein n=1 Tax=Paenibacillus sp. L3-i20 TaxID=2905833 RepID=UPI001EDDC29F|nr:hypothetical protein [Paenibacillus sp. L3-i20]GKU78855.1 hypothetical protein L3i20_v232520 [Paenibacillus sp. L3-i20]
MTELIKIDVITKNMIQYCYTCPDAHKCDTEEKCKTCWEAKGLLKKEDLKEQLTTEQLLTLYAQ